MEHLERSIAEGLLSIRAVFFRPNEPFTWASGIKSPVYCDNRLILTHLRCARRWKVRCARLFAPTIPMWRY